MNKESIESRNLKVIEFFKDNGMGVVLYGTTDNPLIIWKNRFILPCYVHNFKLNFCSKRVDGEVLGWLSLNLPKEKYNKFNITDWMSKSELTPVKRIVDEDTGLLFSGFSSNKFSKITTLLFSNSEAKYYFDDSILQEDFKKILNLSIDKDLKLSII
jgi:hypothetical protein